MPDLSVAQEELRVGARVLSLFANPLNVRVLRAHAGGPQSFSDLKATVGWSAESTLRAVTRDLSEVGALERDPQGGPRGAVATALTEAGEELLFVADILQAWLTRFPSGPIALDGEEAKSAVKALAGGWSSTLIRELATTPMTLSELSNRIPEFSYPALERRLNWMRMTGQIEAVEGQGRGTPYAPTEWLRRAIGPVAASGHCERLHMGEDSPPVTESDVEAAMLLVLPLAPLPETATGTCLLAAHTDPVDGHEEDGQLAGVTVVVERGKVVDLAPEVAPNPPSWALATPNGWLDAVLVGQLEAMRLGGADLQLALDLVAGLHMALTIDRGPCEPASASFGHPSICREKSKLPGTKKPTQRHFLTSGPLLRYSSPRKIGAPAMGCRSPDKPPSQVTRYASETRLDVPQEGTTMIKNTMLLAAMAIAAVAFAVPAVASANWTHSGEPLEENASMAASGEAEFTSGGNGAKGEVTANIEMEAGTTTAKVTDFTVKKCTPTGGLTGLFCTGTTAAGPFVAHVVSSDTIRITAFHLTTHFYLDAAHTKKVAESTLKGDVLATVNNGKAISSITSLTGVEMTSNGNPATVAGSLGLTPAGTYGLE